MFKDLDELELVNLAASYIARGLKLPDELKEAIDPAILKELEQA